MEENQIGLFIRDRRIELGLTQQQLAEKLDITDKAVSKWERCLSYPHALLITTMTEVDDIEDLEGTLATRGSHEEITRQVGELFRAQRAEVYPLSTESCAICQQCTYPEAPCRHPDRMFPCVESHGVLLTDTMERFGIDFQAGGNVVTWFSLILYRD